MGQVLERARPQGIGPHRPMDEKAYLVDQFRSMIKRCFPAAFFVCSFILLIIQTGKTQVAINTSGAGPDASAILDVQSTSKGMLIPRMNTAQVAAIASPADGLMVYDTDKKSYRVFSAGRGWSSLELTPSGRIYVSESFPDPLYPLTDYDYMGVFTDASSFRKNAGILSGSWITKANSVLTMTFETRYCYTGADSNKILVIGAGENSGCDSCILVYNLAKDSVYKETVGYVRRYGGSTTTDTANNRIFIWGGYNDIVNGVRYPQDRGFIYNYNTGVKTLIDSTTAPAPRYSHAAVWAASAGKLLIFGGYPLTTPGVLASSVPYAYDPVANGWSALATCPLSPRNDPIALYDGGDHWIVFGGKNAAGTVAYTNGAVYTISTNSWTLMSAAGGPAKEMIRGSWTGTEVILSSANTSGTVYDYKAYRYNIATNSWTVIPDIPLFDGKWSKVTDPHLWTGSQLFQLADLLPAVSPVTTLLWAYSPVSNTWAPHPANNITGPRNIQAGNTSVFISNGTTKFNRYEPTGFGAIYAQSTQLWHYYKKK